MSSRQFTFYLFENFDPASEHPLNPRRVLTSAVDGLLSMAADGCAWDALCDAWGEERVRQVADCGVLRRDGAMARLDAPVFLREDAPALSAAFSEDAERQAELLSRVWPEIVRCADRLHNGFDASVNLYHIVCGMVMDGAFFDTLCEAGVVTTGRAHVSGLDYIAVAYERCEALDALSRRLLCSWNRAMGKTCTLQSFGDADGDRFDAYRWYRLKESGQVIDNVPDLERLTREARRLVETGICDRECLRALTAFGYVTNGCLSVPVYHVQDMLMIDEIAEIVRSTLLEDTAAVLRRGVKDITPVKHGVSAGETANELYHLLFGRLNQVLVRRGMVAAPPMHPGEGRYLQSIMMA